MVVVEVVTGQMVTVVVNGEAIAETDHHFNWVHFWQVLNDLLGMDIIVTTTVVEGVPQPPLSKSEAQARQEDAAELSDRQAEWHAGYL